MAHKRSFVSIGSTIVVIRVRQIFTTNSVDVYDAVGQYSPAISLQGEVYITTVDTLIDC